MSASIPLIIISTGLATALAVGAYQHFETVGALQDQISELEVATQKPLTFEEMDELKNMFIGETSKSAPSQGQDGSAPDNWIYGNTKARFTLVEKMAAEISRLGLEFSESIERIRVSVEKPGAVRFARQLGRHRRTRARNPA